MNDIDHRLTVLRAALAELGVTVEADVLDAVARNIQAAIDAGQNRDTAIRRGALQLLAGLPDRKALLEIDRRSQGG